MTEVIDHDLARARAAFEERCAAAARAVLAREADQREADEQVARLEAADARRAGVIVLPAPRQPVDPTQDLAAFAERCAQAARDAAFAALAG